MRRLRRDKGIVALNRGNALDESGRWREAAAAFEAAIAAGELSARLNLAHILDQRLLRPTEARRQYELAWAEGDRAAAIYLAYAFDKDGDHAAALEWMRRAVDADVPDARWRYGELLTLGGDISEGLRILDEEARGGDANARLARALVLREAGRVDEAYSELRRLVAEGTPYAAVEVARIAADRGHETEARRWYELAVEHDRSAPFAYAAYLTEVSDDAAEVVGAWERVVAAGDLRGHLNLAAFLVGEGRVEEARAAYARAHAEGDEKAARDFDAWRDLA